MYMTLFVSFSVCSPYFTRFRVYFIYFFFFRVSFNLKEFSSGVKVRTELIFFKSKYFVSLRSGSAYLYVNMFVSVCVNMYVCRQNFLLSTHFLMKFCMQLAHDH